MKFCRNFIYSAGSRRLPGERLPTWPAHT